MAGVKLTSHKDEALEALARAKQQALKAIGMTAETYAKELTPVDTGRLRNSISHAIDKEAAYIGTNVEYAPYVEFGTRRNKAHHMLRRAASEHYAEYKALVEDAMKNV